MQTLDYSSSDGLARLEALYTRPACPPEIEERVRAIVGEVMMSGDVAVFAQIKKFDGADLNAATVRVSEQEIADAEAQVSAKLKSAVALAIRHVRDFAKETIPSSWISPAREGVLLGEQFNPMQRVACYVPGGTAPLVSSAIHTVAIAKAAGVPEIVAATPPRKDGTINPATLYALKKAGATEIYKMGGATAIAALAYGTSTIRPVEKIVGPGNAYVAAAKRLVYGRVAIDMVAGPSEVMVIADKTANPEWIAADMLSQAEHGSGLEQAVLVTDSKELLSDVHDAILRQADSLTRQGPLRKVIENGIYLILAPNLDIAAEIGSKYAPEHLELQGMQARKLLRKIKAAGAIFLGEWTPEPAGDFTAGPSHVLPTAGTAKFFHGITASDFIRRSSILSYTEQALAADKKALLMFAGTEGLDGHGRSISIRFDPAFSKKK